ncbi:trichohyalin-like isoform X2 [Mya arenaria]|uniref:trichohyalin-like isoform X2 n=1 Tax=Mya arenaria TaxID=6604 RepID=UPI0022E035DE|nr:trichohyalin-like isoform X2 [Mya arenaria]
MASPPFISHTGDDAHQRTKYTDFGSISRSKSVPSAPKIVDMLEPMPASNEILKFSIMPAGHYDNVTADMETPRQDVPSGKGFNKKILSLQIRPLSSSNERRESLRTPTGHSAMVTDNKSTSRRQSSLKRGNNGEHPVQRSRVTDSTSLPIPSVRSAPKDVMRVEDHRAMPSSTERLDSLDVAYPGDSAFCLTEEEQQIFQSEGQYVRAQTNEVYRDDSAFCLTEEEQQIFQGEGQCLPDIPLKNKTNRDNERSLQKEIRQKQKECKRLRKKEKSLQKDINQLEKECKEFRKREKSLQKEIKQLKEECKGLRRCNNERSFALNQKQSELAKKRKELLALQETIRVKDECLRKYNDTLRTKKKYISDLELELADLKKELSLQLKRHHEEESKIATFENDKKKLEENVKKLDVDKKKLEENAIKLAEDQKRLDENSIKLAEDQKRLDENAIKLAEDQKRLEENAIKLAEDQKREGKTRALENEIHKLRCDNERLEDYVKELTDEITRLNKKSELMIQNQQEDNETDDRDKEYIEDWDSSQQAWINGGRSDKALKQLKELLETIKFRLVYFMNCLMCINARIRKTTVTMWLEDRTRMEEQRQTMSGDRSVKLLKRLNTLRGSIEQVELQTKNAERHQRLSAIFSTSEEETKRLRDEKSETVERQKRFSAQLLEIEENRKRFCEQLSEIKEEIPNLKSDD